MDDGQRSALGKHRATIGPPLQALFPFSCRGWRYRLPNTMERANVELWRRLFGGGEQRKAGAFDRTAEFNRPLNRFKFSEGVVGLCKDADNMKPFLLLLLLFLLLSTQALTSDCPQDCSCGDTISIFCLQRRSSTMPLGIPAPTKNLYLFQNGIKVLSRDDFAGLSGLELLDLSQNQLSEIPDRAFELLPSLENLDLSSNLITRVSRESFSGLAGLMRLYLHGNHIQSIHPEAFQGLDQLLELKLQGNQLTGLPALRLPRLLLLDLSHNAGLLSLGPADLQTPKLEALKMAGLGISELNAELLRSLGNLHELDVSRNQLREPGPRLEDLQNLRGLLELDLSGLNMQGLPEGFRHLFPRLRLLTAAENPFNCLCPLAWLPGWLREGRVQLGRPEETRCHFPPLNAGKVLAKLEPSPSSSSSQDALDPGPLICPSNICLNGGTCLLDARGELQCTCSRGTSGPYCETREELPPPPPPPPPHRLPQAPPTLIATAPDPDLGTRHVTSTSILLDLQRFIHKRPYLRGIRLTYRNLSGPDRRPVELSVPASYPEYTLRGLRPNSTYSICAGPLGAGAGTDRSCTEARTVAQPLHDPDPTGPWTSGATPHPGPEPQVKDGQLVMALAPALAAALTVAVAMAVAAGNGLLPAPQAGQGGPPRPVL
ncbi:hypothetical protein SKAU_G00275460 [Synaphobranchus kaupii]|uniref:EGF-like domain-containing protein n=1 Tax=Synaphobranchus kaupii TaxID=118154 RepID=A0A9Q1F156_SYNKA|nr:hypothetical protein SKAU_G00275460 [Synaphobranchus kaupii]